MKQPPSPSVPPARLAWKLDRSKFAAAPLVIKSAPPMPGSEVLPDATLPSRIAYRNDTLADMTAVCTWASRSEDRGDGKATPSRYTAPPWRRAAFSLNVVLTTVAVPDAAYTAAPRLAVFRRNVDFVRIAAACLPSATAPPPWIAELWRKEQWWQYHVPRVIRTPAPSRPELASNVDETTYTWGFMRWMVWRSPAKRIAPPTRHVESPINTAAPPRMLSSRPRKVARRTSMNDVSTESPAVGPSNAQSKNRTREFCVATALGGEKPSVEKLVASTVRFPKRQLWNSALRSTRNSSALEPSAKNPVPPQSIFTRPYPMIVSSSITKFSIGAAGRIPPTPTPPGRSDFPPCMCPRSCAFSFCGT
mmetsp:Transcript_16813/g.40530  ORF Transcript_16813/g.40530 Transcript_16813/m.40530 type:complete len:362 (-) Transcript_16813:199-1284(-)